MRQFLLFCVSGGLAFVIDATLTQAWVSLGGLDPWSARALAFPVAVTFTWWFNRHLTFGVMREHGLWREWSLYVGTQLAGWALNLGSYAAMVILFEPAARWPALAVAVGSIAGLLANFFGAKHVAFRQRR
ncbi:MAG: GtrA family protein [Wenzhouxiangella sp.]